VSRKHLFLILKLACFFLFIGRGWQHFFWNAPYRVILWDESLLSPFIELLTPFTWQEYVSSDSVHNFTQSCIKFIGVLYFLMSFITIFIKPWHKKLFKLYAISSFHMFVLACLVTLDKGSYFGLFFEHAIQIFIPVVFAGLYLQKIRFDQTLIFAKVFIALTFIGHGLFAVGFYPVPGNFVEMVISTFGLSEPEAYTFLRVAGCIDFIAAIFIFIPKIEVLALGFMTFWGMTTAFARTVSHIDFDLFAMSANQWVFETIYRLPHGLLPLFLMMYLFYGKKKQVKQILSQKKAL